MVLRNLRFEPGDVVLHFTSIYPSCLKTIRSLEEAGAPLTARAIDVLYPAEDDEVVDALEAAAREVAAEGKRVKLAIFDSIVSGPGVRVPWERLVATCRRLGILSLVDAAHGIGHIDMTHTGSDAVSPGLSCN